MSPAWYPDEFKMAGVDFEDAGQVEAYDRNQTASTTEKEQALVARLGILPGQTVIDMGAGTGTFAVQAAILTGKGFASAGAFVHAVDVSQAMLTYAESKAHQAGVIKTMKFHQAGFLSYEHKGDLADVVVTKNALHILPDFWKMTAFLKIAAMLKLGGKFYLRDVIFSFSPAEYKSAINHWVGSVAKPKGEGWTQADFEMHVREEYSTFTWIVEAMLTRAGFDITESNYPSPTYAEYFCTKAS